MLERPKTICGTWTLKGDAAEIVLREQDNLKAKSPIGKYSKQKTIQLLLCELYALRKKDQESKAA